MDRVADGSVALVVTSPPYFAGKQYEEELEREGVPSSYLEYLEMLTDVFAECVRKLEPGGRIAVNVANLGRKPYRSLSADVIRILEHDLGLLLRGELIWQKGEGASGSCAWGSFRSAANPVLRDISERVIVASKGRFDRARSVKQRAADGLPHESTLMTEDFMALTLDIWSIPPESARRVGHPAPVPGRAARAADPAVHVHATISSSTRSWAADRRSSPRPVSVAATSATTSTRATSRSPAGASPKRSSEQSGVATGEPPATSRDPTGKAGADKLAEQTARRCRLHDRRAQPADPQDRRHGRLRRHRRRRRDVVLRRRRARSPATAAGCCAPTPCGGRSGERTRSRARAGDVPLVLLTTHLPRAARARATPRCAPPVRRVLRRHRDVVGRTASNGSERYAKGGFTDDPQPGFWTAQDLAPDRHPQLDD